MSKIIPSKDKRELFMRMVYENANYSKDPKTRIGAVLTVDDSFVSSGFNGFARKVVDYEERWNKRELKHIFVCHAEHNAVLTAARLGRATLGTTLYTQGVPCASCCNACIQAGVKKFVVHMQWPNLTHSEKWVESVNISRIMMAEADIKLEWFDKTLGMKGLLDGNIIDV